jgi:ketosteroid isomerase-like protein
MLRLILVLLLLGGTSVGQSPFDGTWVNRGGEQLPPGPASYSLTNETFRCSCAIGDIEIKPDGYDHKTPETAYWDTLNAQPVDAHTVVLIAKKVGQTMFTEIDSVSQDGNTLTQMVKDTTEAETVTIESQSQRVESGPAGYHTISGKWKAFKASRSRNGSLIKYTCTKDAFSAETPLGERYTAKFDGNFYPVEDDPGHTMVSAQLVDARTVELTSKRNGKIVSISRLSVAPDGNSIHAVYENKESDTKTAFDFEKADDAKTAADAIRQQIARYTAALDAADLDLASQVWRTSAEVSFIHPAGHARGWEEVKQIYKFFGSSFSERKLTVRDMSVHVNGDTAWVEFYWHFVGKRRNDGSVVQTDGRETQIYNQARNRWELVHVHYSSPTITR